MYLDDIIEIYENVFTLSDTYINITDAFSVLAKELFCGECSLLAEKNDRSRARARGRGGQ